MKDGSFSRYGLAGILNTGIHALVFGCATYGGVSHMVANVAAFLIASSFSFLVNARWTFASKTGWRRYILFVGLNGVLAAVSGKIADELFWTPLLTFMVFAGVSWIVGYCVSRYVVFK